MSDSSKPDLDENTNVRIAHRDVEREAAAATREFSVRENGLEPISVKLIVLFAVVTLLAGGILFKDSLFNYSEFPSDYRRGVDPNSTVKGPPVGEAYASYFSKGKVLYSGNCASCHGADGMGTGVIPPLGGSEWVTEYDTRFLAIAVNGVSGPIVVNGKSYDGAMPNVAGSFSDFELAALSTYVRNDFGNQIGKMTSLEQIKDFKTKMKERKSSGSQGAVSANELTTAAYFSHALKGDVLEDTAKVNKKTGEPIE